MQQQAFDIVTEALQRFIPTGVDIVPLQTLIHLVSHHLKLPLHFVSTCIDLYYLQKKLWGIAQTQQHQQPQNLTDSPFSPSSQQGTPKFIPVDEFMNVARFVWVQRSTTVAPATAVAPNPQHSSVTPIYPFQNGVQPMPSSSTNHGAQSQSSPFFAFTAGNVPPEVERKICKQYRLSGTCSFGSRCLYHHSVETAMAAVEEAAKEKMAWGQPNNQPPRTSSFRSHLRQGPQKRTRAPFYDISNTAATTNNTHYPVTHE